MDYAKECKEGRQHAARVIEDCRASDHLPALVRQIREAAVSEDGESVGFLFRIAQAAMNGSNDRAGAHGISGRLR